MAESRSWPANRRKLSVALHEQLATRRAMADKAISLAHLLGRPVTNAAGTRIGRVNDVVVRWDAGVTYPAVTGVLVGVGDGLAVIAEPDVVLSQTGVGLRSDRQVVTRAVRAEGDVALARDVLDRQLVDTAGVQVVRAADVYLLNGPRDGNRRASTLVCGRWPAACSPIVGDAHRRIGSSTGPSCTRSCPGSPTPPHPGSRGLRSRRGWRAAVCNSVVRPPS